MYKHIKRQFKRFRNWMRYNPPSALSSKGWRLFNKEFEETSPIRYYFHRNFKKTFIWPISFRYRRISEWIRYRTYDRYHILDTGLDPGYYDISTKMLNVNFNMLKNHVEIELAKHSYWCGEGRENISWCEKHMPFYYIFYPFCRPDIGIKHCEWASTLDDPALPINERSDRQAKDAREILALYYWWVNERPARKELEHVSYNDQGMGSLGCFDDDFDRSAEDYRDHVKSMDDINKQEEDWSIQDDEMLIRLMKIRHGLWA